MADLTPHAAQRSPHRIRASFLLCRKGKSVPTNVGERPPRLLHSSARPSAAPTRRTHRSCFWIWQSVAPLGPRMPLPWPTFFGLPSAEDRQYYAGLLLTTSGLDRVKAHNFTTVQASASSKRRRGPDDQHSATLPRVQSERLPLPDNTRGGPDFLVFVGSKIYCGEVVVTKGKTGDAYRRKVRTYQSFCELTGFEPFPFSINNGKIDFKTISILKEIAITTRSFLVE